MKDVGRAIALWWLAREQSGALADRDWASQWGETLGSLYPAGGLHMRRKAGAGLRSVEYALRDAHAIALNGVLAPHATTLDAYCRAYAGLRSLIEAA